MAAIRIRVLIDDGPRAGATLTIDSDPVGEPPDQLALDNPLGPGTTTYHLHELDERREGWNQMSAMVELAQQSLSAVSPIGITLSKILYHPEVVMLAVRPAEALNPVLEVVRSVTRKVAGNDGETNGKSPVWTPHVTISYSTAEQSSKPIINSLGSSVEERKVLIESVSLVIQWGRRGTGIGNQSERHGSSRSHTPGRQSGRAIAAHSSGTVGTGGEIAP
jgi:hypothetical protein